MANKHPQQDIKKKPGRKRKPKLNPQQELFAQTYVMTNGDLSKSKEVAGYSRTSSPLNTKSVAISIEENRKKMEQLFQNAAQGMFANLLSLATSSTSDNVRFQASKDLLDRAGFKPIERKELTGSDGQAISVDSRITHDLIQRALLLEGQSKPQDS